MVGSDGHGVIVVCAVVSQVRGKRRSSLPEPKKEHNTQSGILILIVCEFLPLPFHFSELI